MPQKNIEPIDLSKCHSMTYEAMRPFVQSGYIVGYVKTDNLISHAICDLTGGMSHIAGIVCLPECYGQKDRVWTDESTTAKGVRMEPLSQMLMQHHGQPYILPLDLSPAQKRAFELNAMKASGQGIKYDFVGILEKLYDLIMPRIFRGPEFSDHALYCAGRTYRSLKDINFQPLPVFKTQPAPAELFAALVRLTRYKPIKIVPK